MGKIRIQEHTGATLEPEAVEDWRAMENSREHGSDAGMLTVKPGSTA